MKSLKKNNISNDFFYILDHQMIFESAGDLPTSVEAKGEAGFFFPAPPSLFFAGKGNHPKKIIWRKQDQVHNDQASQGGPGGQSGQPG